MVLNINTIVKSVTIIILIIIIFSSVSNLIPFIEESGDTLEQSGVPLGMIFTLGGIVGLIVAIFIFFIVFQLILGKVR